MRVLVNRSSLLEALGRLHSIVEGRVTLPILANVMITARNDWMVLTTTNMDVQVTYTLETTVEESGETTVPAVPLYEIVRKLPEGSMITITQKGKDPLSLKAGRFATTLGVLPVEEFPSLGAGSVPVQFTIESGLLRQMIDRTRFAISTDDARAYLGGIYFHVAKTEEGPRLRAVATDAYRLALAEEAAPEGAQEMPGVIVPRKTVNEVRKLLDNNAWMVEIALSETRIRFRVGRTELISKLVDGIFPEYERVIPRENDKVMRVTKKDFAEAVARVAALSADKKRPVKLSLSRNLLVISVTGSDLGSASEELDESDVHYDGAPIEFSFQARYITDITDQIDGDVEFVFSHNNPATIVRDAANQNALYVLMPMRL